MSRPFPDREYDDRARRVRSAMGDAGIDVLYVTDPADVVYLCGYEAVWYSPRMPFGVAMVREPAEIVLFDWSRHKAYDELHARCDEIVYFEYSDGIDTVAFTFVERGWTNVRVGIGMSGSNPSGSTSRALHDALDRVCSQLIDGDWLVAGVRAFKSDAEIDRVRRAGRMADKAMRTLRNELVPGMTELQVSARLSSLLADAGSEIAATQPLVSSGPTAWLDTHAFPSRRPLEVGDTITIDCCGVVDRYHANLCRTFSLGDPHPAATSMVTAGRRAIETFCASARVGERPEAAMAEAERLLRSLVPEENIWWIGGYGLGIGMSPSWVGHTYLDNSGPQEIELRPGYVSNFETILVSEEHSFEAGSIDTIIVTSNDVEIVSAVPREIQVVPIG